MANIVVSKKDVDGCFSIVTRILVQTVCLKFLQSLLEDTNADIKSGSSKARSASETKVSSISRQLSGPTARKWNTVTIFDWDDTFFCTSYFTRYEQSRRTNSFTSLMRKVDCKAAKLLEQALRVGAVYIVTNAEKGWLETTAETFMPTVESLFSKIGVISARDEYAGVYPNEVDKWKMHTFLDLSMDLPQVSTNLLSIGDSEFELEAARVMSKRFAESMTKTIKLRKAPSPETLAKDLEFLSKTFSMVVKEKTDLRLTIS
eukprot:TRINITY_DN43599_c0_g1_i1.p1 TRINITY_DN43599_c0_g1~~TRINITY_DN43599_c0_g1_i1.p1  ORF type:complete len:260 (+),score=53.58 TRINITY_DN43599_c0_g1_i1:77-856(+)